MPPHPTTVLVVLVILAAAFLVTGWAIFRRPSALERARQAIDAGEPDAAREWAEIALTRARHPLDRAAALDELGAVHRHTGAYPDAEACYREALTLREETLEPDHGDIGASLGNVGLALLGLGRPAEAEPLFRRAVDLLRPARGDDDPSVALVLAQLGQACMYLGRLAEADDCIALAARLTERAFGRLHRQTAEVLLHEAGITAVRGKFHPSDRAYRACRAVHAEIHSPDHPAALVACQQHANLLIGWFRLTGDREALAEAESLALMFVDRTTAVFGPGHQLTGAGLRTLARVRTVQGRAAEAIAPAREALRIMETVMGPDHMRSGLKRLTLARALDAVGESAEALHHADRGLEIYVQIFGPDHFELGDAYETLGLVVARRGQMEEAEALIRKALAVRQPLGRWHPVRAFALRELVPVLRGLGRDAEADQVEAEVAEIVAEARKA